MKTDVVVLMHTPHGVRCEVNVQDANLGPVDESVRLHTRVGTLLGGGVLGELRFASKISSYSPRAGARLLEHIAASWGGQARTGREPGIPDLSESVAIDRFERLSSMPILEACGISRRQLCRRPKIAEKLCSIGGAAECWWAW